MYVSDGKGAEMPSSPSQAVAYLDPGSGGGFRLLVVEITPCGTAEEFARVLRDFTRRHPGASLHTWSQDQGPKEVSDFVLSRMAGAKEALRVTGGRPSKERVLPYLQRIAESESERWWTTRELATRCQQLGWSSSSGRATGTIVRRLPSLDALPSFRVVKKGRGRATRWQLSMIAE